MTFEQIRLAIESKMALWTEAPVAFDGAPTGPAVKTAQQSGTPWARLTIQSGDSFTAGVGSNPCVRRTGSIMVQIFTARDIGSRPALLLADSIAAHLEYWQSGQLETQAASVMRVGPRDNYYQINVSCPYRAG